MEVFGLASVLGNLAKYDLEMQARIQEILDVGGDVGLQMMDSLVAVDTGYMQSRDEKVVEKGSVMLRNDTPYFLFVELGHHTESGSFVPPQPAMVPAFVVMENFIMDELKRL
jgi:hypothetical protein